MNPTKADQRLIWLYSLTLKLYPSAFRADFADEMCDVFAQSLSEAVNFLGLFLILWRELWTLPFSLLTVHRQAFRQLPIRQQRRRQTAWFVRIFGGLLSLFLLSTFQILLAPSYHLYVQAVPFMAALFAACISILLGLIWGRAGGLLTIASGAAVGGCMSLYIYVMGFAEMGWMGTVFIGLIWALPFLIFGILFYELGKPPERLLPPA